MATTCTSGLARIPPISRIAWVPKPTQARVIFSLGATNPAPPSTCRGTIVKAVAAAPPARINWRRERPDGSEELLGSSAFLETESLVFMANLGDSWGVIAGKGVCRSDPLDGILKAGQRLVNMG